MNLINNDSLYYSSMTGVSDSTLETFYNILKEHKDWECIIDLKFRKLVERSDKSKEQVRVKDTQPD